VPTPAPALTSPGMTEYAAPTAVPAVSPARVLPVTAVVACLAATLRPVRSARSIILEKSRDVSGVA
jgi:hypothetical protein